MRRLFFLTFLLACGGDDDVSPSKADSCVTGDSDVQVLTTDDGIHFVRTPDAAFEGLEDYDFSPNYAELDGLRMHYIDVGPPDGDLVVMIHGEPTWSYLYRHAATALVSQGHRVVAIDLIGMGRSDKPVDTAVHTYEQHVDWVWQFIDQLDAPELTLVVHDWGGLIGLRIVGDHPDAFSRVVALNTTLPIFPVGGNPYEMPEDTSADCALGEFEGWTTFQEWMTHALLAPDLRAGHLVQTLTATEVSVEVEAAYDAPYPSRIYKAGIRAFPSMMTAVEDQNQPAWDALGAFDGPFLTLWGALDPVVGSQGAQDALTDHIPGARGQYHERWDASHFVQEDVGPLLGATVSYFITATPLDAPECWEPEVVVSALDCEAVCDRLSDCDPDHPHGICMQGCQLVDPYLTEAASSGVMPCMLESECGTFDSFGAALDGCMAPLIFGGQLTPQPGNTEVCEAVGPAVEACDPETGMIQVCEGLAAVFTSESMARIGDCADVGCDGMRECLMASNCTFVFDNVGAVPD